MVWRTRSFPLGTNKNTRLTSAKTSFHPYYRGFNQTHRLYHLRNFVAEHSYTDTIKNMLKSPLTAKLQGGIQFTKSQPPIPITVVPRSFKGVPVAPLKFSSI